MNYIARFVGLLQGGGFGRARRPAGRIARKLFQPVAFVQKLGL